MTNRPKGANAIPPERRVRLTAGEGDTLESVGARALVSSEMQAALTFERLVPKSVEGLPLDVTALMVELGHQRAAALRGDMKQGEGMLAEQACTLNALFHTLARWSVTNFEGGRLDAADRLMRLAMKAQGQSRATWETLAEIKNPRAVAFVRQANIAQGPQQVNNGTAPARAEQPDSSRIGLLEEGDGERLDTRAAGAAIGGDPSLAPVGALDRAADGGRKGPLLAQRRPG